MVVFGAICLAVAACNPIEQTQPDRKAAIIDITPKSARMWVVGDSVIFSADVTTEAGTDGADLPKEWIARDPTLLKVSANGVATSLRKGASTYVVLTVGGKSDSVLVEVTTTPCGSVARTTLAVGQVMSDIASAGFCAPGTDGAEYVLFAFNSSLTSSSTSSLEITGLGLSTAVSALTVAPAWPAGLSSVSGVAASIGPKKVKGRRRDVKGELALLESERVEMSPLVASAQAWYRSRKRGALRDAAPPVVGDVVPNVNTNMGTSCTVGSRVNHNARVTAVSNSAILLEDVTNPTGGFSDDEYASIAAQFDTLVTPVDVPTFGAPTDLDGNGRVVILFTRAINELTPTNADTYTGGRTMTRDLMPTQALLAEPRFAGKTGCDASNVAEIFYMLAPDPTGVVNANKFSHEFVAQQTVGTIAHEYQHMINFSRRMYLLGLSSSAWFDEIWLHEGLSHMAEELVFHRASGIPTRTNIGLDQLVATDRTIDAFNSFMLGDFTLYHFYADGSSSTSPFHQADDLATRGATWSFLRYAADHLGSDDGVGTSNLFYKLVNSGLVGLTNLESQINVSPSGMQTMIRDFVISVYVDDWVAGVDAKYTQPSWNMRSIYPGLCDPDDPFSLCRFPLAVTSLAENTPSAKALAAGGFAVFAFVPAASTDAFVRATGPNGGAIPPGINVSVLRTK